MQCHQKLILRRSHRFSCKREKEQQKKEAKKKEQENKKLKKEIEKSKLLTPKPNSMSVILKAEAASSRSQSFNAASSKPLEEDVEECVVEEITTEDEKPKVDAPEPIDEEICDDIEEPPPPTAQCTIKKPSLLLTVTSVSTKSPAISLPCSCIISLPGKVSDCKKSFQSVSPSDVRMRTTGITCSF